jgi:hypothetical protein
MLKIPPAGRNSDTLLTELTIYLVRFNVFDLAEVEALIFLPLILSNQDHIVGSADKTNHKKTAVPRLGEVSRVHHRVLIRDDLP